jgi:hypothetical protein
VQWLAPVRVGRLASLQLGAARLALEPAPRVRTALAQAALAALVRRQPLAVAARAWLVWSVARVRALRVAQLAAAVRRATGSASS